MYWSMGNQYFAIAESNGRVAILRVGVAVEVPARIDEGVHRVGLAPRRSAALRAGGVHKLGTRASGEPPCCVISICSGSSTGN